MCKQCGGEENPNRKGFFNLDTGSVTVQRYEDCEHTVVSMYDKEFGRSIQLLLTPIEASGLAQTLKQFALGKGTGAVCLALKHGLRTKLLQFSSKTADTARHKDDVVALS